MRYLFNKSGESNIRLICKIIPRLTILLYQIHRTHLIKFNWIIGTLLYLGDIAYFDDAISYCDSQELFDDLWYDWLYEYLEKIAGGNPVLLELELL